MLRAIGGGIGKLVMFAAVASLVLTFTLFLVGIHLVMLPTIRKSSRYRRVRASAELASAFTMLASTFTPDDDA